MISSFELSIIMDDLGTSATAYFIYAQRLQDCSRANSSVAGCYSHCFVLMIVDCHRWQVGSLTNGHYWLHHWRGYFTIGIKDVFEITCHCYGKCLELVR